MEANMSTKEYEGKFIGTLKIEMVDTLSHKTENGVTVYSVLTKGGRRFVLTQIGLDLMVSDKSQDWTTVRSKHMVPLAAKMLGMLLDYGVSVGDMEHLFSLVGGSVDQSLNRATSILWNGDDKAFAAGSETNGNERTLVMADIILKEHDAKKDGGGETDKPE